MKIIEPTELNSLYAWMNFIVNEKDILLTANDCHLKVFGDDDFAYLLVNVYDGDSKSVEYYLKAEEGINGLFALISVVQQFSFSVKDFLDALPALDYRDAESGCYAVAGDMKIFREVVESN